MSSSPRRKLRAVGHTARIASGLASGELLETPWLKTLLERSTKTAALQQIHPHVPRRLRVGQFQRRKLRATRPKDLLVDRNRSKNKMNQTNKSKNSYGEQNVASAVSAWGSPVGPSFVHKGTKARKLPPGRTQQSGGGGSGKGGKVMFNTTSISTTATTSGGGTSTAEDVDGQNKRTLHELANGGKKNPVAATSGRKAVAEEGYSMEKSSLGPKQLFLLNQFMGFDKFTGMEREDLVDLMVNEWMTDPYVGDDYRQHVELYCESSFAIDRRTSEREFPNRLNTAVCCDMLQMIARKDTKYRRALKLVKAGIFASIFSDYQEADESGRTFLEMTPFYTVAKRKHADIRKEYETTKADARREKEERSSRTEGERRERDEELRRTTERTQQETRTMQPEEMSLEENNPRELLGRLLFDLDPDDVADIIEREAGSKYRQAVAQRWVTMAKTGRNDSETSNTDQANYPVEMTTTATTTMTATTARVVIHPETEAEQRKKRKEIELAMSTLMATTGNHAERVLLHAIGSNAEDHHGMDLRRPSTKRKKVELPTLQVLKTHRRKTEADNEGKRVRSFLNDSVPHNQKVLVHSIAGNDAVMREMLEQADGGEDHIVLHDRNLLAPARDPNKEWTDEEMILSESVGHGMKVLVHSISHSS